MEHSVVMIFVRIKKLSNLSMNLEDVCMHSKQALYGNVMHVVAVIKITNF